MRTLMVILLATSLTTVAAQDSVETLRDDSKNDKTNRLYDILADYQLNYDAVDSERYAYVVRGTQVSLRKNQATKLDLWFLGVKISNARRLDASSKTTPSSTGRYLERWKQRLRFDGQILMRGPIFGDGQTFSYEDADDEDYKRKRKELVVMRPMDQVLAGTHSLTTQGTRNLSPHLGFLADYCKLKSAEYTESRDIAVQFDFEGNYNPTHRILYTKTSNYLPTDIRISLQLPNRQKRTLVSHMLVKWGKRNELYVPVAMKASSFLPNGDSKHLDLKLDWRIGSELPTNLLDPKAADWRESTRVLFDVDWQRRGVSPPDAIPFQEDEK